MPGSEPSQKKPPSTVITKESEVQLAYNRYIEQKQNVASGNYFSKKISRVTLGSAIFLWVFTSDPKNCLGEYAGLSPSCIFQIKEIIPLTLSVIGGFCLFIWLISIAKNNFRKDQLLLELADASNFPRISGIAMGAVWEEHVLRHVQSSLSGEE